jgi:hypothetical protein
VRWCSSLLWAVYVVRTAWCSIDDNNMKEWCQLWRAHEWFVAGQDGENATTYQGAARVPPKNTDARIPSVVVYSSSRSSRANNRFPPRARCRRKRPAAEKARWVTGPPLFFRAFSHARRLSLTAGRKGRPRLAYATGVYFDVGYDSDT